MRQRANYLAAYLSDVTTSTVNVDSFRVHKTGGGRVDVTKSDLFLHFVDQDDKSVINVDRVLDILDRNVHKLNKPFKVRVTVWEILK